MAVSSAGTTVVIGANLDDNQGSNSGAGFVFVVKDRRWELQATLAAADGGPKDLFGTDVATSGSGDVALFGALLDDDAGLQAGAAYVFRRVDSAWTLDTKLVASDGAPLSNFGSGVAVSADGSVALIGARRDPCPDLPDCQSGAAYVYTWDGASWSEQSKLTALDAVDGAQFGAAAALSAGGEVALVGAHRSDGQGAAYVFVWDGTAWTQQARLTAPDGMPDDLFGAAVALSAAGDVALVGAEGRSNYAGGAYVFGRDGTTWSHADTLTAPDGMAQDRFGASVALDAEGQLAIAGAFGDDPCGPTCQDAGAAYVFERKGNRWTLRSTLHPATIVALDNAGASVSASGDGSRILVGAPGSGSQLPGTAYVFELDGEDCNENVLCDPREIAEGSATDTNGTGVLDECEGDLDGDGTIGIIDFQILLALWGPCPAPPAACPADLDGNGSVGIQDFLTLLLNWT